MPDAVPERRGPAGVEPAKERALRRVPPAVWILAPLALAGLYALAHGLFARKPALGDVVPGDAILTHRFRDTPEVDRSFFWPVPYVRAEGRATERIAAFRNVPGLAGVDRRAPAFWVLLPRRGLGDPTLSILPLDDPDAFREAFTDPELVARGFVRHAQHLEIRGDWAAVAWDREAVRRLGEGGLQPKDVGEDHAIAADVPALIAFMAMAPVEPPWASILDLWGFGHGALEPLREHAAVAIPAGRVLRVAGSWGRLDAWFWHREARLRIHVEARADATRRLLAAVADAPADAPDGLRPPPRAHAWLWTPGTAEARALAQVLFAWGVAFPPALEGAEGLDATRIAGPLLLWTEAARGHGAAWTLGIAAPVGSMPALDPFLPEVPEAGQRVAVPEGVATLTIVDRARATTAPAGEVVRRTLDGSLDVITVGPSAAEAMERFADSRAPEASPDPSPPSEPRWHLLASFFLSRDRARQIFGSLVEPPNVLQVLGGGDIEGALWTDGQKLRLDARAATPR